MSRMYMPPACPECGSAFCEELRRRELESENPGILERNDILRNGGTVAEARAEMMARHEGYLMEGMSRGGAWTGIMMSLTEGWDNDC